MLDGQGIQDQGCQIFLGTTYQNGKKSTKCLQNLPNGHKLYQNVVKYTKPFYIFEGLPKYYQFGFLVCKYAICQPCPRSLQNKQAILNRGVPQSF
jgi:hypothetical protein